MGETSFDTDFHNIDLEHLHKFLQVLRNNGVTSAEVFGAKFNLALPDLDAPLTFQDIDQAEQSKPLRHKSPSDVKFPGKV